MLKIYIRVTGLIAAIIAIFLLIADGRNTWIMPFMSLFLGLMLFGLGLSKLKNKHKFSAYSFFFISIFNLWIAVYTIFY
ncbi:DUF3953 domain-containing protein [Mesobacillus zeae]|nr:DUF3953 domain-containing protein [Mesobacillus zeae]